MSEPVTQILIIGTTALLAFAAGYSSGRDQGKKTGTQSGLSEGFDAGVAFILREMNADLGFDPLENCSHTDDEHRRAQAEFDARKLQVREALRRRVRGR